MKSNFTFITLIALILITSAVVTIRAETSNGIEEVKQNLLVTKNQANQARPPVEEDNGYDYSVPNNIQPPLTEIVITSDDIRSADVTGVIGVNNPMNKQYIIDTDVVESINNILIDTGVTYDTIPAQYKDSVLQLRYIEMLEGISESKSTVKSVLEEYNKGTGDSTK